MLYADSKEIEKRDKRQKNIIKDQIKQKDITFSRDKKERDK